MYTIAAVELVIIVAFVLGVARRFTYGAVFAFHGVATLAPFPIYRNPTQGMLFYAAWPMLAACFTLYLLRDICCATPTRSGRCGVRVRLRLRLCNPDQASFAQVVRFCFSGFGGAPPCPSAAMSGQYTWPVL
jgi:hypothetical protein